ncbi:hypothetical protein ABPG74_016554 [Tetrahymena malaccensis]
MGQKESIHHHILLYGQSGHGKTNFLYDNFLNGKWEEEQQKVESSLGYNFELITTAQDQNYGVWDISGHPEFLDMQDLFLKTIPFTGIMYIIRPKYHLGSLVEDKLKEIGQARQQIFYLTNHKNFTNKFILIVLNIEEEQLTASGDGDVSAETLELLIDEIKELVKYDQIQVQQKGIIIMDRGSSYTKLWEKVGSLIQGVKAIEKKKDQQKD